MVPATTETAVSLREFLETVPPGSPRHVTNLGGTNYLNGSVEMTKSEILLHCDSETCKGGARLFKLLRAPDLEKGKSSSDYLTYVCKNCSQTWKTFAVRLILSADGSNGTAFKYGEDPSFGPPTPSKLISLFGPQKDIFLKGRRCENQGLGIGAFAYYRRIIEDQKNRIFDEIIRVCTNLNIDQELVAELTAAQNETQFTKAVESIKQGLPQALLVNGYNPLTLLHAALSEGLHAQTDEECLELATSIRVVMAEFVERVKQAIRDEVELVNAVNRLARRRGSE